MDELRFEEIYAGFHAKIVRYLTRLVGETEAEDLAQETFVKVGPGAEGLSWRGTAPYLGLQDSDQHGARQATQPVLQGNES